MLSRWNYLSPIGDDNLFQMILSLNWIQECFLGKQMHINQDAAITWAECEKLTRWTFYIDFALLLIQCNWQSHSYFNSISSQYCYFCNLQIIRSRSWHFCQSNQNMCPMYEWDLSHSFRLLFLPIVSVKSFCFICFAHSCLFASV